MNNVYAFVVGIDWYDQPKWTISGPCTNALAVTDWLLKVLLVPPENIFVFLDAKEGTLDVAIQELEKEKVSVSRSATEEVIDTFWRTQLRKERPAGSRLFMYWSGHGFADKDGSRIFICRDYTETQLKNRVFNGSNFLRHLHATDYQFFSEQIFLADVCALHQNVDFAADKTPPKTTYAKTTKQVAYFATPEDQYATGNNGRGVFTEIALGVLGKFKEWPKLGTFVKSMQDAFAKVEQTPFRISGHDGEAEITDSLVGSITAVGGSELFKSVVSLLTAIELPDAFYRPHYLRTVSDLGIPELNRAQGLAGMIRELANMRDASPSQVPFGLLQFLVRLSEEKELAAPIEGWLAEHAAEQGNALANVREKLADESAVNIVVVEVTNNEKGEIAAFELFVRTHDFVPVPDITYSRRAVKDWDEFCTKLLTDIQDLQQRHSIADFEIHFLVDPPLFDQPFHGIKTASGATLGDKHIVLLRHGSRVRSANTVVKDAWKKYADELRPRPPSEIKLVPVPSTEEGADDPLPKEKGICYLNSIVQPASRGESGSAAEKLILQQLLSRGVPYLLWMHSLSESDGWKQVETSFTAWLRELASLDQFPAAVAQRRFGGSRLASQATLLWDDPQFNPFQYARGVKR